MKTNQRYKLELTPYYLTKDEESCDLSANHLYGKFLNYVDEEDYVGASLAKRFLKNGDSSCGDCGHENNKFKIHYSCANKSERFKELKKEFYCE
jgi:hypothetical protein